MDTENSCTAYLRILWIALALTALWGVAAHAQVASPRLNKGMIFQPAFPYLPHSGALVSDNPAGGQGQGLFSLQVASISGSHSVGATTTTTTGLDLGLFNTGENFGFGVENLALDLDTAGVAGTVTQQQGVFYYAFDYFRLGVGASTHSEVRTTKTYDAKATTVGLSGVVDGVIWGVSAVSDNVKQDFGASLQSGSRTGLLLGIGMFFFPSGGQIVRMAYDSHSYPAYDNVSAGGAVAMQTFDLEWFFGDNYSVGYRKSTATVEQLYGTAGDSVDADGDTFDLGVLISGWNFYYQGHTGTGTIAGGVAGALATDYQSIGLEVVF